VIGLIGLLRFKWTWLIIGVVLIGIGAVSYLSAHAAAPAQVDGTISSYVEFTRNGSYDRNELQLTADSNTYTVDKTSFHPTLPDSVVQAGKVSVWIDQGSTTVIAITLYDENDRNPTKYTTNHYDNPQSERSDMQTSGMIAGIIGAILIAISAVWVVLGRRRPAVMMAANMGVRQTPSAPASSSGTSADGKWYWDGVGWQHVSEDGRYRWDGATWQELGTVYSARGAPPPPGA
jgi:hypothetical protein